MKLVTFARHIGKKFGLLISLNTLLLFIDSIIEAVSLISLVVVVDLFLNLGSNSASMITQHIVRAFRAHGLPVTLTWFISIFLVLAVLKTVFQILTQYYIFKIKYAVVSDILLDTFKDFFGARWQFFAAGRQGTLLNTFIREISIVGDSFGAMASYFSLLLQCVLFLAFPLFISWKLTLAVLAVAVVFSLPFMMLGKINYRLGKLNTSTANEATSVIAESLSCAKIILGFNNQGKVTALLRDKFNRHCQATLRSQTLAKSIPFAYHPVGILILITGLFIARRISLPLSETLVLFYALCRIIPLIGTIISQKATIDNFFPSYEQIMHLRENAKQLKQDSGKNDFVEFQDGIVVKDISFSYPQHGPVLSGINMVIPKGKMVAIVGDSGGGKSSLIDILMHFNDPESGKVLIDGVDLKEIEVGSYRQSIGYVPQDAVLFNMSIRDNLIWADERINPDDIKRACRLANAEEFINSFPARYDTQVGDRGVRLSGGQVQRIALARAILRKPKILILDEATSSLDTYSERQIQDAIEKIAKETTVIAVAHRLSTIVNADYIYVLSEGKVVEEGNYTELIKKNGKFKHMVGLQSLADKKELNKLRMDEETKEVIA